MPVTAVRAGDVVGLPQRFANPNRHRFFPDIQMRQSRHQRAHIELVHLVFKLADHHHAPIDARPVVRFDAFNHLALIRGNGHWEPPAIFAKTANTTAKSLSATPIPRAAVKNSFVTAVVGMGTSNCRPSSSASSMSFCIMLRSEEHTSELQSQSNLVCRLLLEKKKIRGVGLILAAEVLRFPPTSGLLLAPRLHPLPF